MDIQTALLKIRDSSRVSRLRSSSGNFNFMAYKFGIGIFGGLNFGPGGFKVVRLSPLKGGGVLHFFLGGVQLQFFLFIVKENLPEASSKFRGNF